MYYTQTKIFVKGFNKYPFCYNNTHHSTTINLPVPAGKRYVLQKYEKNNL